MGCNPVTQARSVRAWGRGVCTMENRLKKPNELNTSFEKEWVASAGDQTRGPDQNNLARDHCATETNAGT